MKLNPINSVFKTLVNLIKGQIHFTDSFNKIKVKMEDGQEFEIFRHVIIGKKEDLPLNGAIFIVRFKLSQMSMKKNKIFSRIPIPMFIGLPGFKAKFWMCNEDTGYNQGIYQWETLQDAENYSKSFAVKFMTIRSEKNSISYKIIENSNIYTIIDKLKT